MLEKMSQLVSEEELIKYLLGVVPVILAYYDSGQQAASNDHQQLGRRRGPAGRGKAEAGGTEVRVPPTRRMTSVMDFFGGRRHRGGLGEQESKCRPAGTASAPTAGAGVGRRPAAGQQARNHLPQVHGGQEHGRNGRDGDRPRRLLRPLQPGPDHAQ